MNKNICSIWSYQEIVESGYIGKKQSMIASIYAKYYPKPLTAKQVEHLVSEEFGEKFQGYVWQRLSELEEKGFIKKHNVVPCEYTGKRVNNWIYTGRRTPYRTITKEVICHCCDGIGLINKKVYVPDNERQMTLL